MKDRIARVIIDEAETRGVLRPWATIIEATAGNTGIGLALAASARGYGLACVLPEKMSEDKRKSLRLLGAEVIVTANAPPSHADNFQNVATRTLDGPVVALLPDAWDRYQSLDWMDQPP